MNTALEQDTLSVDTEVARIGGGGNGFYLVKTPKTVPKLKIDKECQLELVVIPYKTTCSPRVAPGKMYFFRDYYRYKDLGPAGKDSYFDCAQTFNEKCPIGDSLAAANQKRRSQRMGLFNVFVVAIDQVAVNKLYLLDFSYFNFAEKLFEAANSKKKRRGKEYVGAFPDPKTGSIVQLSWKEGSYLGTKFFSAGDFDFEQHNGLDGQVATAMASAIDLDAALNKLPYDTAKAMFVDCVSSHVPQTRVEKEIDEAAKVIIDTPDDASRFDQGW